MTPRYVLRQFGSPSMLLLVFLVGCQAKLYIAAPPAANSLRLVIQGQASLRKNTCYPIQVKLSSTSPTPLTFALRTNAAATLYKSLSGCEQRDSNDVTEQSFLGAGESSFTVYVQMMETGTLSVSAQLVGITGVEDRKDFPVVFTSFNPTKGLYGTPRTLAYDGGSDKWYAGGGFTTFDDQYVYRLVRLNADGSRDPSFAPTGTGFNNTVVTTAIQTDGKVLVGGIFTAYNGTPCPYIARLNTDGSLDPSFTQTGTGFNNQVAAIAVQPDGKILAGGFFLTYNGTSRPYIARLNTDGSLDTSFAQTGTGLNSPVNVLSLQTDNKIVGGGYFTSYNGTSRPYIVRLNTDGSLDTTLAPTGTGLNNQVASLAIQPDGKFIVVGTFSSYNGTSRARAARLNSNGTLDATFAQTGTGIDLPASVLALQADGKVIVGGTFTSYNGTSRPRVLRLNSDGTLDTSFAQVGNGINASVNCVVIQGDGKPVLAGSFTAYGTTPRPYIGRLNTDGSLDLSFAAVTTGFNGAITAITPTSDGKTLIGGGFSDFNGTPRGSMARLNNDGSLDTGFVPVGTGFGSTVNSIEVLSDGKILAGGNFTDYNGITRRFVARLNTDATLDPAFVETGTGFSGAVYRLKVQADGKILVSGSFITYNGASRTGIARLNSNGSLDTSFATTGTGFLGGVQSFALQPDGKVVVVGAFSSYNGTTRPYIARLNTDGSLDSGFVHTGTGFNNTIYSVAIQPDAKIVVSGAFTAYNGTSRTRIARLNSDGSLDTSFALTGTGLNALASNVTLQNDGKVVAGGDFTNYNGTARQNIVRLNSDGSLDTAFAQTEIGFNGTVNIIAIQSDSKLLVGGIFSSYYSSTAPYLDRLTATGGLD